MRWKGRHQAEANGYSKDPAKEGMDMDHSKVEGMKEHEAKANGYVKKSARKE
jgi:hypothetical protein